MVSASRLTQVAWVLGLAGVLAGCPSARRRAPRGPGGAAAPVELVFDEESLDQEDVWGERPAGDGKKGGSGLKGVSRVERLRELADRELGRLRLATGTCDGPVVEPVAACEEPASPAPPTDDPAARRALVERLVTCLDALVETAGRLGGGDPLTVAGPTTSAPLRLTRHGATMMAGSARALEPERIFFESNPAVGLLAVAAVMRDEAPRLGAVGAPVAVARCERLLAQLAEPTGSTAGATVAPPPQAERASELREHFTCAVRLSDDLRGQPALRGWPGCPCGRFGRVVEGVCVEGNEGYPFAGRPVDARVPAAFARFIVALKQRLPDLELVSLKLRGCSAPRLERGSRAQTLDAQDAPLLPANLVSVHASATACDLDSLALRDHGGELHGFSVGALTLALMGHLHVPESSEREDNRRFVERRRQVVRRGVGAFYRALEAAPRDSSPSADEAPAAWQLRVGAVVRNTLVDAGLVVFDPLLNRAHADHFHAQIPADTALSTLLADSATSAGERERQIADSLARAAGLKAAPAGANAHPSSFERLQRPGNLGGAL